MKKLVVSILCLLLVACSSPERGRATWMKDDGKLKILCTTGMIQDVVARVGGDRVEALALIGVEIDPHGYELVKGDHEKLQRADIVFFNGLGLEHGASLNYQLKQHSQAIGLGDTLPKDQLLHEEGEIDPHVWMDIQLWSQVVDPIVATLSVKDPEGAGAYEAQGAQLKEEMLAAHQAIYDRLHAISQEKRYIVTSHDAFNYFTRAYLAEPSEVKGGEWRARFEAPEGLAPEGQLSSFDIAEVVDHLMRYDTHVVFPESNVSQDSLKKIVDACSRQKFVVSLCEVPLYGDSMGPHGTKAGSYLGMIEYDAEVIASHLE